DESVKPVGGHVAGEVVSVAGVGEAVGGRAGRDGIAGDTGAGRDALLFAVTVAVVGPRQAPSRIVCGTYGAGGFQSGPGVVGVGDGAAVVHVVGDALNLSVV